MQLSQLHLYSVGYACENLDPASKELEVYPVEVAGYSQGELTATQAAETDDGEDFFGQKYSVKVNVSHSIKATWLNFSSNRATPPNIRRGEKIFIWRFADVDKYYWMESNETEHLRRLETVIFRLSNTRDESVTQLTSENTYYLLWSTHTKQITLVTTKSDGEPFAYTFQFNTEDGIVTLQDDIENFFELNSSERRLTLQTADKARLVLDKLTGLLECPESVTVRTKKYIQECETSLIKASKSITHETLDYTIKADQLQGIIVNTTFTGTMTINGLTTMNGGIAAKPGAGGAATKAKMEIPISFTKEAKFNDALKQGPEGAEVDVGKDHDHTSTAPGSPTSAVNP